MEEYNNNLHYTFKKDLKEYKMNLNPIGNAIKQIRKFIEKVHKVPEEESLALTKKLIKDHKAKNPIVTYYNKNEVGDMEKTTTTLSNYISEVAKDGNVIVPSFTVYTHPSKKKSIHSEFLFQNVIKRTEDKHNAFKYKQLGDKVKEDYYETMQKIRKIFNNSVSGAYGSKGTILSNYSAHYTLTSITRSVASIGNMTTESLVAGNKYFKDADVTINYIVAIITGISKPLIERVVDKFNIYIPTADELMEMILFSTRWYWSDAIKEEEIYKLLCELEPFERCAVMYINDLWHFKKYNDTLMRDIISGMGLSATGLSKDNLKDIGNSPEGIMNLVHLICNEDIKGMKVDYKALVGTPLLDKIGSTAKQIQNTMDKYFMFFKAFYTTDILPTSIAYIRDMLRDAIVLSDTDSTCGAYDKWVEWYYGDIQFHPESIGIAGSIMTINTQLIDHHIKVLCANMNVDKNDYEILKMKNEFYWPVFVATNASKHYYADTYIREGNVFKESEMELKGVHLIASTIKIELKKLTHKIMEDLLHSVKNQEELYLKTYIDKVAEIEMSIVNSIRAGDVSVFKRMPVKGASTYKNGPDVSPYQYHTFWETNLAEKYGSPGMPPYTMVKIPLILENKTAVQDFLLSIKDEEIKSKMTTFFNNRKANDFKTLRLPLDIAIRGGIPTEFLDVINMKRIINDNLYAVYMVLETLGFHKKPKNTVYETLIEYDKENNEDK